MIVGGELLKKNIPEIQLELKTKQYNFTQKIQNHLKGDAVFQITLSTLFDLASRASEIFESSPTEQKRRLLHLVFSSLLLNGKKLVYNVKKPFDVFIDMSQMKERLPE